jgi:hypothetical protein
MSFGWSAAAWTAIAVNIYSADQQRKSANKALDQNKAAAKANQQAADEANNRANQKSPDVSAMLSASAMAGRSGQTGTLLTGPQGIDTSSLTLGKTNLLGA